MRVLGMLALLTLAAVAPAPAIAGEGDAPAPTLGEISLGEHWFGPEVTKEDLEGKVVLFVLWGT